MEHSLETLNTCPTCGGDSFAKRLSPTDYTFSKVSFQLVECSNCSLLFTNPRPSEKDIGPYYDNPEYVSHTDTNKGLLFALYAFVKRFTLSQKRKLIARNRPLKTVLDYGAGTGDFSAELATNGWDVTAYEPDQNARKKIVGKSSKIKLAETIESIPSNQKSVITLWHVLEHIHQLPETIAQFHRILIPSGQLIIAVPNYKCYDAEFYKANWAAYDVPRHLYHFSYDSLKTLIETNGFRMIEIKPMWFDSFYVSLLSEKNTGANGLVGWVRAFLIGSISTFSTLISTKRCSSIIYIFEKVV